MEMTDLIGSVAAFLTTTAFFPQVVKVLRTRDTGAISLGMYSVFTTGVLLWLIYGILTLNWPILLGNIVTFTCALAILVMKIRCG